jgi:hypothetical protein
VIPSPQLYLPLLSRGARVVRQIPSTLMPLTMPMSLVELEKSNVGRARTRKVSGGRVGMQKCWEIRVVNRRMPAKGVGVEFAWIERPEGPIFGVFLNRRTTQL